MRVGGLRVPKTGHGLPTDMLGRYVDTTVSLSASHHRTLCAGKRCTVNSQRRAVGNDGLLPVSRGVRCYSVRGGDGAAGQRGFFVCQRVLAQQ
jgi:hypothetical protein